MTDYVRLSLKVPADVADTIKAMARDRNTTITQVIRDAVSTEEFIWDVKRKHGRVLLSDDSGEHRWEIIIR